MNLRRKDWLELYDKSFHQKGMGEKKTMNESNKQATKGKQWVGEGNDLKFREHSNHHLRAQHDITQHSHPHLSRDIVMQIYFFVSIAISSQIGELKTTIKRYAIICEVCEWIASSLNTLAMVIIMFGMWPCDKTLLQIVRMQPRNDRPTNSNTLDVLLFTHRSIYRNFTMATILVYANSMGTQQSVLVFAKHFIKSISQPLFYFVHYFWHHPILVIYSPNFLHDWLTNKLLWMIQLNI